MYLFHVDFPRLRNPQLQLPGNDSLKDQILALNVLNTIVATSIETPSAQKFFSGAIYVCTVARVER